MEDHGNGNIDPLLANHQCACDGFSRVADGVSPEGWGCRHTVRGMGRTRVGRACHRIPRLLAPAPARRACEPTPGRPGRSMARDRSSVVRGAERRWRARTGDGAARRRDQCAARGRRSTAATRHGLRPHNPSRPSGTSEHVAGYQEARGEICGIRRGSCPAVARLADDLVRTTRPLTRPGRGSYARAAYFGSRGKPSTRSPRMLRCTSLVPAQIDDAW